MADVNIGGLLSGLVSGAGFYNQYKQFGENAEDYRTSMQPIIQQGQEALQFKPYTITSSLGGIQAGENGAMQITPSQQLQNLQDQSFGGAQQLFSQALAPQDQRIQDVYGQIRALAQPGEQQQRLATEERLAAQGRLGLQSAQYGGTTPEMLAQEQAIAQARNQAALQAITQAQAEQQQAANLGSSMLTAGYTPTAQLMNQQQIANQMSELGQRNQLASADLLTSLSLGGLEAQQISEANRMQALQQLYSLGAGMLGGTRNSVTGEMQPGVLTNGINKIGNSLIDKLGSWLGGGGSNDAAIDDIINMASGYAPASDFMPSNVLANAGTPAYDFTYDPTSTFDFSNIQMTPTEPNFQYNPNGAGLFNL
jgi:hypothetical protein